MIENGSQFYAPGPPFFDISGPCCLVEFVVRMFELRRPGADQREVPSIKTLGGSQASCFTLTLGIPRTNERRVPFTVGPRRGFLSRRISHTAAAAEAEKAAGQENGFGGRDGRFKANTVSKRDSGRAAQA